MNTYAFDLDLGKRFSDQVVIIGQSDHNGTTLTVTLYKDGTAFTTTGLTAYFAMRLPGNSNYYRTACTYNAGVVTCTIDEEYAGAIAGRTDVAYFELHQGNTIVASTARFLVVVLESATHGMTEGYRYDDEVIAAVHDWLTEHPEKVTTVQPNGIDTEKLAAKSVTEPKLADEAVSTRALGGSSVTTAKLDNLSVTEAKLAANSVTTAKLVDGSVTVDKLDQSMFKVVTDAEIAAMLN